MASYVPPHETVGDGPHPVIALHGWFTDHRGYAPMWPHLDRAGLTYAFMDCRGYGQAMTQSGAFTMDEVAGDALTLADHLGWSTFSLLGHSMGGVAIQRVLVRAPGRVRGLVGVNPVPASGMTFDDQAWALFTGAVHDPDNRRAIIDLTTGNRLTGTWLDAMVARSRSTSDVDAFARYLHSWAVTDFHEQVAGSTVPAKVIVGEHDPAITADLMRQSWQKWYATLEIEVLGGAGHYPMEETPIALATSVERFLSGTSG